MTITMSVKPQISKLQTEKSCKVGFNVLRRFYYSERLLSESSRLDMLAFRMYIIPRRSHARP
jgi:hypothetical protein